LTVVSIGVPMIMSRRWRRGTPAEEETEEVPYGPAPTEAGRAAPTEPTVARRASDDGTEAQ